MLSNHLQDGIETARLVWSRLPNSEEGEPDVVGISKNRDGGTVESLDYEVIENYAYREEQVSSLLPRSLLLSCFSNQMLFAQISSPFCYFPLLVWNLQAQRGKLYVIYQVAVKWFFALLIGIGELIILFRMLLMNSVLTLFSLFTSKHYILGKTEVASTLNILIASNVIDLH